MKKPTDQDRETALSIAALLRAGRSLPNAAADLGLTQSRAVDSILLARKLGERMPALYAAGRVKRPAHAAPRAESPAEPRLAPAEPASALGPKRRRELSAAEIAEIVRRRDAGERNAVVARAMGRYPQVVAGAYHRWRKFGGDVGAIQARMDVVAAERAERSCGPKAGYAWDRAARRPTDADEARIAAAHVAHGGFEDVRKLKLR